MVGGWPRGMVLKMQFVFETERLRVRELVDEDLPYLTRLLGDPEVMHFWPRPLTEAEAAEWLARQRERYARDGHGYWLALDRESGEPVGQIGLIECEAEGRREPSLGYILDRRVWGRGLAQEGAAGCMEYALQTRGLPRVTCLVRPENVRSLRVAVRLGLLPERLVQFSGFAHLVFVSGAK